MAELLTVPYLGTAEEDVLLVDWLVDEGESYRRGQPLAVLETLKASFEIEAEGDGVLLCKLVSAGERVSVQAALAIWGDTASQPDEAEVKRLVQAHEQALEEATRDEVAFDVAPRAVASALPPAAPAARTRAAELGVDLAEIVGTGPDGLVRVEDVERAANAASTSRGDGLLDAEFVVELRCNAHTFGHLSSSFKVALYRRHGAEIGEGVVLDDGAVVIAERLVLGSGVRLGAGCRIEAEEFVAGTLAQLGARCQVRCRRVRLGENAFFAPDVEVGGGGAMDPEAELVIGNHGFVGEHSHLNPCRAIAIGDEVVISRQSVIMTHSFGGSVLQGYPSRFAGVTIGDRCQVGIAATLFPGVAMGDGAILLSGSSLVTSVPPGRFFGGVPAKDLKAAATPLSGERMLQVAQELVEEFAHQLALRGLPLRITVDGEERQLVVDHEERRHRLHFAPRLPTAEFELFAEDVRVCLSAEHAAWQQLGPELVGIDLSGPRIRGHLGPLASTFREFLRKRGVRLSPRTWTYERGWL